MILLSSKSFRKRYEKLTPKLKIQCRERMNTFELNPFYPLLDNHQLHGEYTGYRSINITGDYRAIFYHENNDVVRFIDVGTHHELFGT